MAGRAVTVARDGAVMANTWRTGKTPHMSGAVTLGVLVRASTLSTKSDSDASEKTPGSDGLE